MQSTIKNFFVSAWEILEVVFVATATVFLIRTFLVQPFVVSGASMEPNFSEKDYLLIDEITYRFKEPERGEVVVFRYPLDESVFFIKRIIGIPGDQVISQGGRIRIVRDGADMALNEPYLSSELKSSDNFNVTLGTDQYFVLGDNRSHSFDSKNWGAINRENIVGIARVVLFPFNRFEFLEVPSY
ncbi:MAG: signal peptidase I [Patescibacteria group bacterium]